MRSVKDWRLLDLLPFRGGSGRFGGGQGNGDRPLLQKMALLVLKSVAVTVKETRYESSSDSSVGSEADDVDADMAVIERSIREVKLELKLHRKRFLAKGDRCECHIRAPSKLRLIIALASAIVIYPNCFYVLRF